MVMHFKSLILFFMSLEHTRGFIIASRSKNLCSLPSNTSPGSRFSNCKRSVRFLLTEAEEFSTEAIIVTDLTTMTNSSSSIISIENDKSVVINEENRVHSAIYKLSQAALIGILSGWSVGIFKLSIDAVRRFAYGSLLSQTPFLLPLIPALGGIAVGFLGLIGPFPPGLRGTVQAIDAATSSLLPITQRINGETGGSLAFCRKTLAAICTLGTGCSLGPEGPSVEVGMSMSRIFTKIFPASNIVGSLEQQKSVSRLLLACGAASGVSAGFNAPLAGVFFALEIMQRAFSELDSASTHVSTQSNGSPVVATATSGNISAILLSSVLSALIAKALLGDHLVFELHEYTLRTPLVELPLYLLLGALSGLVAFGFSQAATISKSIFDGTVGPARVREVALKIPSPAKPFIGGLLCGLVGLVFPQILFFGYETLNALLANSSIPTALLLSLLFFKVCMTAIAAGSGLVGGTFAPSLFMGGMVGASFHNIMSALFTYASTTPGDANDTLQLLAHGAGPLVLELADVPAYAMVGAASVLAALFRAPLTASLLLFELSRDYDVILPLMASAGVASLVNDLVEQKFERLNREQDAVSWGDLADEKDQN
jgi:H+/Cl- antiporter ClcA